MAIEIKITAENVYDLHAEMHRLLTGESLTKDRSLVSVSAPVTTPEAKAEEPKAEKKAKKEKVEAPKIEEVKAPVSKFTLQQAIDRAKEIAGDGKDDKVMYALQDINTRLGIAKVRELPPEKIDSYMEELEKAFPPKVAGGMFD